MKKAYYPDSPIRASSLEPTDRLVLYTIKGILDGDLSKAITIAELARATGFVAKTVHTSTRSLHDQGWVEIAKSKTGTNVYSLVASKFNADAEVDLELEKIVEKLISGVYVKYPKGTKFKDVKAVLEKPGPKITGKKNITSLKSIWYATIPLVFEEVTHLKPLTNMEVGQFVQFKNKVSNGANPEEVLSFVIENWPEFCLYVKDKAGITLAPSLPHIGYLLKHCSLAVNFTNLLKEHGTATPVVDDDDGWAAEKTIKNKKKGGSP